MPQAAQRFAFDLAYSLASETEFLPDLLQCVGAPVVQTKAKAQDAGLAGAQTGKHFLDLIPQ
jgi:hypothetical protein